MTPPAHQVPRDSAHPAAVEQQLYLVLALLSPVRLGPGTLIRGFQAIDADGRAAAHATRQREGVGVGAPPFGHYAIVLPAKGRPASEAPADLSGLAANALPWPMIKFFYLTKRV